MQSALLLAVSQAVLLAHYAVYVPLMMRDAGCTTANIWGSLGPTGRVIASGSAALAYALHLASLWAMRDRTLSPGVWASTLAFYIAQTAFLPCLRQGSCAKDPLFKLATRGVLLVCAALMVWYAVSVWREDSSPFVRYSALYIVFHVVAIDFLYFGFWAVRL